MNIYNSKAKKVARIGLIIAVLVVSKLAFASLPNIELVSFFIIFFTKKFGRNMLFVIPAYIVIEMLIFGFDIMWVTAYCYIWPLLYLLTRIFGKTESVVFLSVLSGLFGLFFGFLCSFPYLFITTGTNPDASLSSAITWWIAGIPYDIIHGVSNFIIMLTLYKPITSVFDRITSNK